MKCPQGLDIPLVPTATDTHTHQKCGHMDCLSLTVGFLHVRCNEPIHVFDKNRLKKLLQFTPQLFQVLCSDEILQITSLWCINFFVQEFLSLLVVHVCIKNEPPTD